ncbi:5-amino-6-(5-phospho-D-ribitylamino)uracil phosphatase, chloroplastic [Corylus avellana]|uniref:5-amino-6-(5-phospho-D-ribitylamino)uracil phosphatase, chloroplastic n=1 Tax=Corylus avellana TaxID=13451 RepID=UPI001E203785|nr:5-amino-6-(5-phospho-D-ribitylamino)uracil phosphatase, chloroplastic [Corylus avellana]
MGCATCGNFRTSSLLLPWRPSSRIPPSSFPSNIRLMKFRRLNLVKHNLVVRNAFGFDENGSFNGFPITPNKLFMQETIGAEYGEGFETFRPDGPLKVDVDFLNDRLQEGFLKRIRYAMKPDEAYGLIFSWDNVVADTRSLKLNAWKQLAYEEGKEIPEDGDLQRLMLYAAADHVLHKFLLLWDESETELERLKFRFSELYFGNLLEIKEPVEGLKEWLDAVSTARIPCAVVSNFDRRNMVQALERMGLKKYFQAIVTEEDGMESIAHRFLSAAVKLDRKPSKCVVFEDDPRGVTAAHNCTMMAVALIGAHPAYDLVQADLAVAGFNELSVINLRRLFANNGSTFMDLQKQIVEKSPPKRKLTIDTIF